MVNAADANEVRKSPVPWRSSAQWKLSDACRCRRRQHFPDTVALVAVFRRSCEYPVERRPSHPNLPVPPDADRWCHRALPAESVCSAPRKTSSATFSIDPQQTIAVTDGAKRRAEALAEVHSTVCVPVEYVSHPFGTQQQAIPPYSVRCSMNSSFARARVECHFAS